MRPDPWYEQIDEDDMARSHWQQHLDFLCAIDGMHAAIERAADPARYRGDWPLQDYEPYAGDPRGVAVWYVRCVCRKAKGLGLLDAKYRSRRARMRARRRAA